MQNTTVAFLTMEALLDELPTKLCEANFRGGLGILAGDMLRRFADAGIRGYGFMPLYHRSWATGEECDYTHLQKIQEQTHKNQEQEDQTYTVRKVRQDLFGFECPKTFDTLYTENRRKRLAQEIAIAKLVPETLKFLDVRPNIVHLNESHTSLIIPHVREDLCFEHTKTLFTIHTPEQSGMEKFYDYRFENGITADSNRYRSLFVKDGVLDLTWGAMLLADAVNAVSEEHGRIVKEMFSPFRSKITTITNGTDTQFWRYPSLQQAYINGQITAETPETLMKIHEEARHWSLDVVARRSGVTLDPKKPTAWFVRRMQKYKNQYPMLSGILPALCAERGISIATEFGELEGLGMNVVGAGKAAETDNECLDWMAKFTHMMSNENLKGKFTFFQDYTLELLRAAAWGSDIWIAMPEPGREACGTGHQRSAINGIPAVVSKTGGMIEYLQEFDPENTTGNTFFIDPYEPLTIYKKLKIFSDLWYAWRATGDPRYSALKMNVFKTGFWLDIIPVLEKYKTLYTKMIA